MKSQLPSVVALLATFCLSSGLARADEIRLDDGRVLVGKVTTRADILEVETAEGLVAVPKERVVRHRTDADLRRELANTAKAAGDTAFAHLNLAMQARAYGLRTELWQHLERALELQAEAAAVPTRQTSDAGREALQRRLDDFLAQLEPELLARKWRTGDTRVRVHQLLEQVRSDTGPARLAAIGTLLAREPNADQELRTEARRNDAPRRRLCAARALLRREGAGNDHFVLRTAIVDASSDVREATVGMLRDAGRVDAAAVHYLAPGLMHPNGKMRIRTAEALAGLGHAEATRLLVLAGPSAGKALAGADPGIRAHVAILNQQSYIRDFDVEVAQAAFIADPKVDTLVSGSVLDIAVVGVLEEVHIVRAYRQALKQLTHLDPGADPRTWPGWLAGLPSDPVQPPTTAPRTSNR